MWSMGGMWSMGVCTRKGNKTCYTAVKSQRFATLSHCSILSNFYDHQTF